MKISEIFTPQYDKNIIKNKGKLMGAGKLSSVYSRKDTQHEVIKHTNDEPDDGYSTYIKQIIKYKLYEKNPCFPRVFSYHEVDGNYKDISMEVLTPYENISAEDLYQYAIEHISQDIPVASTSRNMQINIASYLAAATDFGNVKTEDNYISHAMQVIKGISKNFGLSIDLHSRNIMYRRYKYGIQLVFSDPLIDVAVLNRINEDIQTTSGKTGKTPNYKKRRNRLLYTANNGAFSYVRPHSKDPFSVVKTNIAHSSPTSTAPVKDNYTFDVPINFQYYDGFYHYLNFLIKSKIYEENPYFLRIRNVHEVNYKNGYKVYNVTIEKLFNYREVNKELLKRYITKISTFTMEDLEDDDYDLMQLILNKLLSPPYTYIKDPLLKESLNIIRLNANIYSLDLNFNNIMFRIGQYGPQLVFSDPYGIRRGAL